jgi:hypothetical protein
MLLLGNGVLRVGFMHGILIQRARIVADFLRAEPGLARIPQIREQRVFPGCGFEAIRLCG